MMGSFSPTDLSRALRSVSTLDWEEALEVWGKEEVRHFTTGIDLAVWTLTVGCLTMVHGHF